jgi:hypothetical protein
MCSLNEFCALQEVRWSSFVYDGAGTGDESEVYLVLRQCFEIAVVENGY